MSLFDGRQHVYGMATDRLGNLYIGVYHGLVIVMNNDVTIRENMPYYRRLVDVSCDGQLIFHMDGHNNTSVISTLPPNPKVILNILLEASNILFPRLWKIVSEYVTSWDPWEYELNNRGIPALCYNPYSGSTLQHRSNKGYINYDVVHQDKKVGRTNAMHGGDSEHIKLWKDKFLILKHTSLSYKDGSRGLVIPLSEENSREYKDRYPDGTYRIGFSVIDVDVGITPRNIAVAEDIDQVFFITHNYTVRSSNMFKNHEWKVVLKFDEKWRADSQCYLSVSKDGLTLSISDERLLIMRYKRKSERRDATVSSGVGQHDTAKVISPTS